MCASVIPTLPWARLIPFAALLIVAAVTFAWWGFLAWLIWLGFRERPAVKRAGGDRQHALVYVGSG
jgi:hypothetical protein